MAGENTPGKHLNPPWAPGQSGNPKGRPKGSRNKLGEDFVLALQEDFTAHGPAVIAIVRAEKPADYLKVVASLLPKQIEVKEGAFDGVSDEQLAAIVAAAQASLFAVGAGEGGTGTAEGAEPADGIRPVH